MLGLGLALSIAKKTLGDAIDGLLSTLRGRATYYENGSASKSTIKAIDNADVLDKATILLTPTATSNARVHSVKTYTGDELVDDSSFALTGTQAENTTGTYWITGTGWSIEDGIASCDGTQSPSTSYLSQTLSSTTTANNIYKVTYTLTISSGNLEAQLSGGGSSAEGESRTTSGTYTEYITAEQSHTTFRFRANSSFVGTIDNVSVTDVSSDFDFDRASSATRINSDGLVQDMQSITDPELVLNGDFEELGDELTPASDFSTSDFEAGSSVSESNGTLTFNNSTSSGTQVQLKNRSISDNNTYKITFTLSNFTSGTFRISVGNQLTDTINYNDSGAEGTHTFYVTKTGGLNRNYFYTSGTSVVASNISVKEVDPNDSWNLGTGWSIEDGKLVGDGTMTASDVVIQSYGFEDGGTYKITFEITESSRGSVFVREPFTASSKATGEVGTHTIYGVAGAANELRLRSDDTFVGKIDNVSIKHVTFEEDNVDLARINYDSNGDNGHILLEPTSTNLVPYSEDFEQWTEEANIDVTNNSIISPDGTQNAAKLQLTGSSSETDGKIRIDVSPNATTHTFSVFAKKGNHNYIYIWINISGANNITRWIDLDDGSVNEGSGTATVTTTSFSNDWWKIEYTFDATNVTGVKLEVADDGVSTGTGGDNIYVWGAQLEELSYSTSYIPTLTGSTVTRATETLNGSGNSTLINSTEGVLYAEIAALDDSTTTTIFSLSNGTNANTLYMGFSSSSNTIQAQLVVGNVAQTNMNYVVTDRTQFNKVAVLYQNNNHKMYINGSEVAVDTSGSVPSANTFDRLNFDLGQGSFDFYGKVKALAVFNEALSDTELTNLTS